MKAWLFIFSVAAGILTSGFAAAEDMNSLLRVCSPQVHPQTMAGIVTNESSGNPYAIFDNGLNSTPRNKRIQREYRPQTKQEAIRIATYLVSSGHVVDLGLGQVNSNNLDLLGLNISDMFEPCTNLKASQSILLGYYEIAAKKYGVGQKASLAAISGYNTGSLTSGFANGYVKKVVRASHRPVPALRIAPAFPGGVISRVVRNSSGSAAPNHGVLAHRPTLLEAKFSSLDVQSF